MMIEIVPNKPLDITPGIFDSAAQVMIDYCKNQECNSCKRFAFCTMHFKDNPINWEVPDK